MTPQDPPSDTPRLFFRIEGTRVSTFGLSGTGEPELGVVTLGDSERPAARRLLRALVAEGIRRGRPLSAGERLEWEGGLLELRVALLELFELDVASGQWVRGAPRLLARLAAEGEQA